MNDRKWKDEWSSVLRYTRLWRFQPSALTSNMKSRHRPSGRTSEELMAESECKPSSGSRKDRDHVCPASFEMRTVDRLAGAPNAVLELATRTSLFRKSIGPSSTRLSIS